MNINTPRRNGNLLPVFHPDKSSSRSNRTTSFKSHRLPFLNWVPDHARNHLVATIAEFVGTTLFLLFAFAGTQVALLAYPADENEIGVTSHLDQLLYISLSFGFSLAVNAWVFFRISGGLFNPAVCLGMCLVGALPWARGFFLSIAQVAGGIAAAAIISGLLPGPVTVRTGLGGGTSVVQGLFIEMFLTALLVFTIFMLAAEKHKGTFIAPIGIGLSLFIAELMGVYFTGGSVNPARSFGPSVVSGSFHSYHWIYWVGPILGSIVASGFYKLMKTLEYETANPGQDSAKPEGEHFNPNLDTRKPSVAFAPSEYTVVEEGRGSESVSHTRNFSDASGFDRFPRLEDMASRGSEMERPVCAGGSSDSSLAVVATATTPPKSALKSGGAHRREISSLSDSNTFTSFKDGEVGAGDVAKEEEARQ